MAESYDKVTEFFSEHETAIYGLGPTDYGAEEGTLLWCIKELDDIYDCSRYFNAPLTEDGTTIRDQILKILCCLTDIYEEKNSEEAPAEWVDKEVRGTTAPVCSRCGVDSIYPTKYCRNCGIRMTNGY